MKRIIMFTGLIALMYLASCTSKKEEKEETEKFTVTNPVRIDTSFTKEYVSQIKSVRNIEVRAREKGFLQKIYVDEGQFVKAGQLLFKIMPNMHQTELLKVEAEQKSAEIELQNTKLLTDKNIVSKNELNVAYAKLQSAKAEVALAKLHLSFTEIRAPFDGTIDRIPLKLGSLIEEGTLMTSLSDNSQMFAYFNLSEPEYLEYQTYENDRAPNNISLVLANGEVFKEKGNVEIIESEFNNETGNIAFRARFPNSDKLLRNGETGQVRMLVPLKSAIVIPQKATYEIQDKKYVFVVDKNNKVNSKEITIKANITDLYIIKSGLTESDKILLEGVQKVKDNDIIKYEFIPFKNIIKKLHLNAQ